MPAKNSNIIAYGFGDIHLTLQTPKCREEKDWLEVQARYLRQVKKAALGFPIVCSGDIFDRWNPAPELIEFALRELPDGMFCVPGQHDLPSHRLDLMHKSGYGVLKTAGKIIDLSEGIWKHNASFASNWELMGFGWNQEITPPPPGHEDINWLLVAHRYVWEGVHKYPDAPTEFGLKALRKYLCKYKAAIFGDNHKGFISETGGCSVLNGGGFIRRKSDEMSYAPQIGALNKKGIWEPFYLDTVADCFMPDAQDKPETAFDMREFLTELNWLGDEGFDFREIVKNHLRKDKDLASETKEIIMEALDGKIN